jgi:hypothetical protein
VAIFDSEIPVEGDGQALQHDGTEDSNHLHDIGDIKPENQAPYAIFLSKKAREEDQDRRLDKREDGVVQDLYSVVPY